MNRNKVTIKKIFIKIIVAGVPARILKEKK